MGQTQTIEKTETETETKTEGTTYPDGYKPQEHPDVTPGSATAPNDGTTNPDGTHNAPGDVLGI